MCQPADSFVIEKIKEARTRGWDDKKIELVRDHQYQNRPNSAGEWSGKLKNPGKSFFLRLASRAVREVNAMKDKNGLTYARKAMVRCGLSKNLNGVWEVKQLFPKLQELVKGHKSYFDGEPVMIGSG